jgi:hypothetical protein
MLITGKWLVDDDGATRPVIEISVTVTNGDRQRDNFLIDTGADRTVFSADLLHRLGAAHQVLPNDRALFGVGGPSAFVLVDAVLQLVRDHGRPALIRGEFAAFTDPRATDLSILGRDVLDTFDVIISRRVDEAGLRLSRGVSDDRD